MQQSTQTVVELMNEDVDVWHQIVHFFGDTLGYGWLVGFALLSAFLFRARLFKLLPAAVRNLFK